MFFNDNVVFKQSLLESPIGHLQAAETTLNTLLPFTFIDCPVGPVHDSKTVSEIVSKVAFIARPRGPDKDTVALLLIISVVTFEFIFQNFLSPEDWVGLDNMLDPLAHSLLLSVDEGPFEVALISPDVFTKAIRLSISVITDIDVTVMKLLSALAMLDRVAPLSFILVSVW